MSQQRNDIQGLRAIAVVAVILFHANHNWLPGGFIGVDIFFVISGFLITSLIVYQKERQVFSLKDFYLSRAKRILPAYFVLLAVITAVMAVLLIPQDYNTYRQSLNSAIRFISNVYFQSNGDYFGPATHEMPLLHTWSLAIEMQFYLLLPLVLLWMPKRWYLTIFIITGIVLLGYATFLISQGQKQAMYFSLLARIPEFLVGSIVAITYPKQALSSKKSNALASLGTIMVLTSLVSIDEKSVFPGAITLLPCLGVACLIYAKDSLINRLLSTRTLVWIGALSYSLYLWHWPILSALRYYTNTYTLSPLQWPVFIILMFVCAYVSFKYVEMPLRNKALRLTSKPYWVSSMMAIIVIAASHQANTRIAPQLPEALTQYAPASQICHGQVVNDCVRGDSQASRTVLMIGDSHAAQLNYFADVVGNALPAKFKVLTASSCVPIPGFDTERLQEWSRKDCLEQIDRVSALLPGYHDIILAGMWSYQLESQDFIAAFNRFLSDANARGQRVIVMAQVPMLSSNVQRAERFRHLGLNSTVSKSNESTLANQRLKEIVDHFPNVHYLDLTDSPLFDQAPFNDNVLLYSDKHHLNELGSRQYGQIAIPDLTKLLLN